jgi:hypothetical protein
MHLADEDHQPVNRRLMLARRRLDGRGLSLALLISPPPPRVPNLCGLPCLLGGQKRQGPHAAAPRQLDQQHQGEPFQAEAFDDVLVARLDRVAVAAHAVDPLPAPPFDGIIRADHHDATGRQQEPQQTEQNPARLPSAPTRPIEHPMVVLKGLLFAQAHYARHAVTVGSRLLFSGYGKVGINHRSLQAGLMGQDTLVVIDEAHLSPVFVSTLLDIKQAVQQTPLLRPFHVMSFSATLSRVGKTLAIDEQKELQNEQARLRLNAKKQIEFLPFNQTAKAKEGKKALPKEIDEELAERLLVDRAIQYERELEAEPARSIVIFVKTVNLVNLIAEKLSDKLEEHAIQSKTEELIDKKE